VKVEGDAIVTTPAREGEAVDTVELERRWASLPPTVTVPVAPVAPAVRDADARRARARALRLTADPVTVIGAGRTARVTRAQLRGALRFPVTKDGIQAALAPAALAAAVRPTFAAILRPAESAAFISGESVSVTPSRPGRRIDGERLATRVLAHRGRADVRLPVVAVAPERTTAQAKSMRIRTLVGEFTTPYACCQPRVTNIKRAAQILDGTIIPADARFSSTWPWARPTTRWLRRQRPRSTPASWRTPWAAAQQIATTVFNASFFAGSTWCSAARVLDHALPARARGLRLGAGRSGGGTTHRPPSDEGPASDAA
jgi:hypothetical protein